MWAGGILLQNDEGHNVTVNGDRYRAMITNFFIPELNNHDVQELWFQQDGATCHTARATIDLLKDTFEPKGLVKEKTSKTSQVSRQTVYRRLGHIGLYARRPVRCVPLTATHCRQRLTWSRDHALWTPQQWSCVMFSDESRTEMHVQSVTMTGHIYRDVILEQHVRLFRGAIGAEFLFMDDNARPHRANIVDE
ncbi:transposable element Tcb1 transposase [Trichonephila clavipes]|nr:transposable element Tcb1 transposase [Trichonephila clavipes]